MYPTRLAWIRGKNKETKQSKPSPLVVSARDIYLCREEITTGGLESACPSGPVMPSSIILFWPSNTASPFSAWTMAKAPRDLHFLSPSNKSSSLIMRAPLYAIKNLKELIPARHGEIVLLIKQWEAISWWMIYIKSIQHIVYPPKMHKPFSLTIISISPPTVSSHLVTAIWKP